MKDRLEERHPRECREAIFSIGLALIPWWAVLWEEGQVHEYDLADAFFDRNDNVSFFWSPFYSFEQVGLIEEVPVQIPTIHKRFPVNHPLALNPRDVFWKANLSKRKEATALLHHWLDRVKEPDHFRVRILKLLQVPGGARQVLEKFKCPELRNKLLGELRSPSTPQPVRHQLEQ